MGKPLVSTLKTAVVFMALIYSFSAAAETSHHSHDANNAAESAESHADAKADPHATQTGENPIDAGAVYRNFCSVCHGDHGDGKSRAQGGLVPPPRDFTQPKAAIELTRDRMIQSVTEGRPGTAMTGWSKRISAEEIEAVVDHIRNNFMPAVTTETVLTGRRVFAENCSVCHGDRGQGAMWARSGLNPAPANFTDPAVKNLTRERMIFSVTYGRPQTAMSSWGKRLGEEDIEAVVDYIRLSIMHVRDEPKAAKADDNGGEHDHDAHGPGDIMNPLPHGLIGNKAIGEQLYRDSCTACHGAKGDGQGPRAYFIFPKPRDFQHPAAQAKYSREHLFNVISTGTVRTEMPAWDKVMTDQEIAHVSEYLFQTFINPDRESSE
jgi:cbb3-type cytochrome c oxidase subunit III